MSSYNNDPNFGTDEPTKLDMLIAQIQKTGTSETAGSVHALSVRLPTFVYGSVEALSKYSGMSRNKMIVQLLEVAMEEVFSNLPQGDLEQVCDLRSQCILELIDSTDTHAQAEKGEC